MLMQSRMLTLKQVRNYFAGRPHIDTVRRWITIGCLNRNTSRMIRLHSVKEGGRRYVTEEAIEQFKRELNEDE